MTSTMQRCLKHWSKSQKYPWKPLKREFVMLRKYVGDIKRPVLQNDINDHLQTDINKCQFQFFQEVKESTQVDPTDKIGSTAGQTHSGEFIKYVNSSLFVHYST